MADSDCTHNIIQLLSIQSLMDQGSGSSSTEKLGRKGKKNLRKRIGLPYMSETLSSFLLLLGVIFPSKLVIIIHFLISAD